MNFITDIPVEINDHDIFRLLGHEKGRHKELDDRFIKLYEQEKHYAKRVLKPRAIYTIKDLGSLPKREIFADAKKVALALATIGPKLEARASQLSTNGKLQRAIVLDAIGSSSAESVADFVNEEINEKAKESGYDYTHRFSPGYCIWDISDQRLFFDVLSAEKAGVRLNQSMMMIPRKSVTFAVNFGYKETMDMDLGKKNCERCDRMECKYRRKGRTNYMKEKFEK
jgi:hypothetical protein